MMLAQVCAGVGGGGGDYNLLLRGAYIGTGELALGEECNTLYGNSGIRANCLEHWGILLMPTDTTV